MKSHAQDRVKANLRYANPKSLAVHVGLLPDSLLDFLVLAQI